MASSETIIDWGNTKNALQRFMEFLNCTLCNRLLQDACSFELCDHYFCKKCALDLVNSSKPCPKCGAVLWMEHLQGSLKIPEVLSICTKLKTLLYGTEIETPQDEEDFVNQYTVLKKSGVEKLLTVDIDLASAVESDTSNTSPLESPPISSQFSNIITKSEMKKGVQRNPRRLVKRPKVTYGGRHKKPLTESSDHEVDVAKPAVTDETTSRKDSDEQLYSVFDFPSQPSKEKEAETKQQQQQQQLNMKTKKKSTERKRKSSLEDNKKVKSPESTESKGKGKQDKKPVKVKKVQLEKKNVKGETPLHAACIKGNLEKVKDLLSQGAQTNTKDFAGWTPLHEASNLGFKDIVALLLDHGAIIDVVAGEDNDTPLHDAVSNNRLEVVKVLLERNAPINVRNRVGFLPVNYAATEEMHKLFDSNVSQPKNLSVLDESRFDESRVDEDKVFVTTNIKQVEKDSILECCDTLGGKLVKDFDSSVTHVICGTTAESLSITRTLKYWYGLLNGKWLLSYKWIEDSHRQKKWLREIDYEVQGSIDAPYGIPRKARINTLKMLPKLFDGCSFYLAGNYDAIPKETISDLIRLGGGKILSREPKTSDADPLLTPMTASSTTKLDILPTRIQPTVIFHAKDTSSQACCTQYIIYDEKSEPAYTRLFSPVLCSATVSWLLDCISNFEILDIKEDHEMGDIHSSQS